MNHPEFDSHPEGPGTNETFTVMYGRDGGPEQGLVVGNLNTGRRLAESIEYTRMAVSSLLDRMQVLEWGNT